MTSCRISSLVLVLLSVMANPCATRGGIDPGSLRLELSPEGVTLTWTGEGDIFALRRASAAEELADPATRIAVSDETIYQDPFSGIDCDPCFYRVEIVEDPFECGPLLCEIDAEYCLTIYPPLPEVSVDYSCQSIPEECLPVEICPCLEAHVNQEWGGAAECVEEPLGGHTIIVALP